MPSPDHYIPGVCNIGPAEIKARRLSGWGGLIAVLVLFAGLSAFGADPAWRLLVFFPATIMSTGFLQARLHFCLGFGFKALFNFGALGMTDSVEQAEFRRLDRRKARAILLSSLAIGAGLALTAYWI